jgi:hypothetical protein
LTQEWSKQITDMIEILFVGFDLYQKELKYIKLVN